MVGEGGGGWKVNLLKGKPFHVGGLRVQTSPFSQPSTPAAPSFCWLTLFAFFVCKLDDSAKVIQHYSTILNTTLLCEVEQGGQTNSILLIQGGDRSEAWDRETMFSQLAKRSSQNVDSGVCHNKYFRSTINLFEVVGKIYVYFVGGK